MRELSLFTGAGGGLLGTKLLGWEHIGYVEINEYCQKLIAQRIKDGILNEAPIFGDIRTFINEGYAESYKGMVDVITAGFPCQPFSLAGKQLGDTDERNLWSDTYSVICLVRPKLLLLENVAGLLTNGYVNQIFGDLAKSGFECRWRILSANEVGAPHKRDRLWIVAYSKEIYAQRQYNRQGEKQSWRSSWWAIEPNVDRVAHGVANRVDRLEALGNGQVPAVVATAWRLLFEE